MRKPTFWFLTWSHTNQTVQSEKMARCLKFQIKKEEGLYYLCSENKEADQQNVGFLMTQLIFLFTGQVDIVLFELCHEKTCFLHICKSKGTDYLISAFVFAA